MKTILFEVGVLVIGIYYFFKVSKPGGAFICLGVLGYFFSKIVMIYYIKKGAHGIFEIDSKLPSPPPGGKYLWEYTAGTGIVPKWVSWIGSKSMFLALIGFTISLLTFFALSN